MGRTSIINGSIPRKGVPVRYGREVCREEMLPERVSTPEELRVCSKRVIRGRRLRRCRVGIRWLSSCKPPFLFLTQLLPELDSLDSRLCYKHGAPPEPGPSYQQLDEKYHRAYRTAPSGAGLRCAILCYKAGAPDGGLEVVYIEGTFTGGQPTASYVPLLRSSGPCYWSTIYMTPLTGLRNRLFGDFVVLTPGSLCLHPDVFIARIDLGP